ncbi:MAG: urea ABC transporter permease subunit UrtB [Alphaproteobacteria bacterium]
MIPARNRQAGRRRRVGLVRLAVAVAAVLLALTSPARAQLDDAALRALLPALAAGGYGDKGAAVAALAATGDPRAIPVLEAMGDRRLYTRVDDGTVVIAEEVADGYRLLDPLTLQELAVVDEDAIEQVKTNNGLRKAIREALGGMTLMGPDPAARLAAANTVFGAQDPSALEALETALAAETDDAVRDAMVRARAAVLLTADDPAVRLEAVTTLQGFGDPAVRSLLTALLLPDGDGFKEPDETVRAAAADAVESIESRLELWRFAGSLFEGLSLGSILLLAAIGLAITFGVMGVINMAHGEMMMIGAYTTYMVQEVFRTSFPGLFDWSIAVAIPAAFLVAGAFGIAIERSVIRWLYGRPLETLLATWGLSLILQQAVRTIFGPTNREVGNPGFMQGAVETASGLTLTYSRMYILAFCLIVFVGLIVMMKRTSFGLQMRAVTANRPMAQAMGIRTGRIDALTFGLGSGIAGLAGVALSQVDNVSPNLGQSYIIDSFLVVVFGGVGNLWGTFAGGMSLGVANKLLEPYSGAVLGKIIILVAVILFIQKRPRGLFALKGRAVEA